MSLKVKLISCLSAFIIVASLMLISVFAASNVTLNIGGNVSFTANSVNAYITGSIVGNAAGGSTLTSIDIDASDADGAVSMPSDWSNMDLTFSESASPITVTINIQNRSTDREISVSLADSTSISNVTVTRECDNVGINATDSRNIPGGETVTYTFELSVQSQNNSANGEFDLSVELENADITIPQGYNVTINTSNMGAVSDRRGWSFYYVANGGERVSLSSNSGIVSLQNVTSLQFCLREDISGSGSGYNNHNISFSPSVFPSTSFQQIVSSGESVFEEPQFYVYSSQVYNITQSVTINISQA